MKKTALKMKFLFQVSVMMTARKTLLA